jgi:3-oxoacyl-[acyl-carrier-protein] synthase II
MKDHKNRPRVVITGIGAISPLGSSKELMWEGMKAGQSGIDRITLFDASKLPCQIAGEIPDFQPQEYMQRKEARRYPRSAQIGLASAMQALSDAGLPDTMSEPERSGVVFGTVLGGVDLLDAGVHTLRTKGFSRVSPFAMPGGIPNLSSFLIARQFQCLGPNSTISTACATGTQSIGEGAELIRRGAADLVIAGGTEALVIDWSLASFSAMRALPINYNDNPQHASRPFDAKREGFVFSEGAAAFILESLEHAQQRNARIYAEIAGYSSSSDAIHIAAPDPDGLGPARAMSWALEDANLKPEQVEYINAHGSSTPINDVMETKAIKHLFGEHAYELAVSSTKSMIGHAMGAAGALEATACVLAIYDGWLPPTINYEYPDPECDLDYIPNQARQQNVSVVMSNSFGLGGQNACLVIQKMENNQ